MVYVRFASVLAMASMAMVAVAADSDSPTKIKNPITTPTVTLPASAMTSIGCFATGTPLENHGPYNFQSPGNCQLVCLQLGKDVMGLSDGVDCWCGDEIPAKAWQTKNETCGTTCAGDDTSGCGGKGALWVVLTGNTRNPVDYFEPPNDAPNTVAIAVGVVIGILGLAAIIFGVWFFLRRKRQHQAEEDYRRNAANVNQFVNGGKLHTSNSSMNDSRLDPSFVDRRQSNGSIADNEDYSRRILKVTNV
ncbi:WSC domain-containing protein [Pyrenophora tritici-repentis]|nr:WSC domain-containing protein [Pyrenophora tritici-repentis]KAI0582059.1 WSC domain-containing protein [Pyrenophora tritici-repentis]KAI0590773.1 WSC domain-containing protein [Pyrenophora tritici-repentis]KAI0613712.1 WSC domain-containing protein [Pyrenophora tritici-repentis]PZC96721.1 WSC domain-containing protein [Pyrenophora tritici-repentis]